jgi:hypothetical protein
MSLKKMFRNKKGLTLIELIISIALLFLVIGIVFSIHLFGVNSLTRGIAKRDLQSDMRLAMDAITKEVRYSETIDLSSGDSTYNHIFVSSNKIVVKPASASESTLTDSIIASPSNDCKFSIEKKGDKYLLHIELTGTFKGNTSNLETDVFLPNVKTANVISNKQEIFYK